MSNVRNEIESLMKATVMIAATVIRVMVDL
jgi:hypothetical protein